MTPGFTIHHNRLHGITTQVICNNYNLINEVTMSYVSFGSPIMKNKCTSCVFNVRYKVQSGAGLFRIRLKQAA